jgi:soluble lytic murein transglycosylase-like protein
MLKIVPFLLLVMLPASQTALSQSPPPVLVPGTLAPATPAQLRERMRQIVIVQAIANKMPPLLLVEVCTKESSLRPSVRGLDVSARRKPRHRRTVSDYSYGLCQVKLSTAQWVWTRMVPPERRRYDIEVRHLDDPDFNAATAAILMGWLKHRFRNWHSALAAYNEGPYRCTKTLPRRCRLKYRSEQSLGKGTYEMSVWMQWQKVRLKATMQAIANSKITLARVDGVGLNNSGGST